MQKIPAWISLALTLGVLGCGRAEYEAQLRRTQERLAKADGENAALGEPVRLNIAAPKFFFRPPRTLASSPKALTLEPMEKAPAWTESVFHFAWDQGSVTPSPLEMWLVVRGKESEPPLLDRVSDFLQWKTGGGGVPAPTPEVAFRRDSENGQPVNYRHLEVVKEEKLWKDRPTTVVVRYDAYVHSGNAVAVVFRELNRQATEDRWREQAAADRPTLPEFDAAKLAKERRLSLSTLRMN